MRVIIIDYGMGNTFSVYNALYYLGAEVEISKDPAKIEQAERIVLPGVGAFGKCMENLRKTGLIPLLEKHVFEKRKPFLGICVGMQVMATTGHEKGIHEGLDWIKGEVRMLDTAQSRLPLPHVGWNDINVQKPNPLLAEERKDQSFYFVHSYALFPEDKEAIVATCSYGQAFCASIQKDNLFATQFHPEKSQKNGLKFLEAFLNVDLTL